MQVWTATDTGLQQKEQDNDQNHVGKLIRKRPKIKDAYQL